MKRCARASRAHLDTAPVPGSERRRDGGSRQERPPADLPMVPSAAPFRARAARRTEITSPARGHGEPPGRRRSEPSALRLRGAVSVCACASRNGRHVKGGVPREKGVDPEKRGAPDVTIRPSKPAAIGSSMLSSKKTAPAPVDATADLGLRRRLALKLLSIRTNSPKSWDFDASILRGLRLEKLH